MKPYWGRGFLVAFLQFLSAVASLYLPTLQADIIDNGVVQGDTGYIWRYGAIMIGVSIMQVVVQILAVYNGAKLAMSFGRDMRRDLFSHVLDFSSREVTKFGAPSLITRNTNDVQQVQMLVFMTNVLILGAPITMVAGVFMALRTNFGLSWIILVAVVVLGIIVTILLALMGPFYQRMQERIDTVNRVLREHISGIRVVRAFVRERYEAGRFDRANSDLKDIGTSVGRLMMTMFPLVFIVLNLSSVAVMWFSASEITAGTMQVGQIGAFISYLMQILMSVMMATMMLVMLPRATVSAGRIMAVLDTKTTVVPPENPVTELTANQGMELTDVAFRYPGAEEPVIADISFRLEPGTMTAVIGATGSGKTTLVNLIPRLYDATSGTVAIDDVDVKRIDPDLLWSKVGLVPQKSFLFTGTVASNLRYGKPDASDEELWHALEVAQAKDFVEAMPGGLEAPIAQGGTNVSGGQRQRLSIARALVKRPEIYVFDDSFSALDVSTDAKLRQALAGETGDACVFIVAQRVSTIRQADQILVLDNGRIVGRGKHHDLLESCPTYQEIVQSQMTTEEAIA
ncbi:MAG: ABC transporter ATP-binding protein/permease [Propionibacteriaceae bacterium]|nr:ABC transporter ATP-binding protein/permease [Propionibacteriaceae bacterium]